MKKVKEFIDIVNKDEDLRFNSRAFYYLTDKGEIKDNIIYIEFLALTDNGEEIKILQSISVEQIEFALIDIALIFSEMVNKFFYLVEQNYGDITVSRSNV